MSDTHTVQCSVGDNTATADNQALDPLSLDGYEFRFARRQTETDTLATSCELVQTGVGVIGVDYWILGYV